MVSPSMNDNFLMIIDDWNWKQVREATHEAINNCKLKIISSIEIKTTQDDSSSLFIGNIAIGIRVVFFLMSKSSTIIFFQTLETIEDINLESFFDAYFSEASLSIKSLESSIVFFVFVFFFS